MSDPDSDTPLYLPEYFVPWTEITQAEISSFNTALDSAPNETAMQQFLERFPRFLLQHLTAGRGYWVIPSKRLGSEHVTDFLIAESYVTMLTWYAVELERPQSRLFTKRGDPSAALIHALRQISDWRNWLSHNRDYASRPRSDSGLGLAHIDPELDGLIIMGRDTETNKSDEHLRRRLAREHRVRIHTYDWLVRQAQGRLLTVSRQDSWFDQLFAQQHMQDTPDKTISKVFGGIGYASVDMSATRSVDWKVVTVKLGDSEHDVIYEDIRTSTNYKDSRSLTMHDWRDWLNSPWSEFDDYKFSLLVSEIPIDMAVLDSLTCHSDGIWYNITSATILFPMHMDVLIYMPRDTPKDQKITITRRAKSLIEDTVRPDSDVVC